MSEYNRCMKINVSHIAKLANLPLTYEEKKKFEDQLSETLDYIKQLKDINTEGIETTSQVTGLENVCREDNIKPSLPQKSALKNAKQVHNGLFKVKAVLEEN